MSNEWRTGMQMSDEELEELYAQEVEREQAKEREPWEWWHVALLAGCLLVWWMVIAMAWKLWPG